MQADQLKLHDIKPLVPIEDYSFYYFLAVSVIAVVLLVGVFYLLLKWLKQRKKENLRKKHLEILRSIDLRGDPKKAAYMLTKYGSTFKDDDARHKEMYENMISKLERYKYRKEVEPFDDETLSIIELYRDICDV